MIYETSWKHCAWYFGQNFQYFWWLKYVGYQFHLLWLYNNIMFHMLTEKADTSYNWSCNTNVSYFLAMFADLPASETKKKKRWWRFGNKHWIIYVRAVAVYYRNLIWYGKRKKEKKIRKLSIGVGSIIEPGLTSFILSLVWNLMEFSIDLLF